MGGDVLAVASFPPVFPPCRVVKHAVRAGSTPAVAGDKGGGGVLTGAATQKAAASVSMARRQVRRRVRRKKNSLVHLPLPPQTSRYNMSLEEERELAYRRLRAVCRSGLVSMLDFR